MSGIDEGIPICPGCTEAFGVIEHPSHWRGTHPAANIWFISERFVEQSPQYRGYYVVFSPSFDEMSLEELDRILGFECGWTLKDRKTYHNNESTSPHYYEKGTKMFDIIFKRMVHYFNISGGVSLK